MSADNFESRQPKYLAQPGRYRATRGLSEGQVAAINRLLGDLAAKTNSEEQSGSPYRWGYEWTVAGDRLCFFYGKWLGADYGHLAHKDTIKVDLNQVLDIARLGAEDRDAARDALAEAIEDRADAQKRAWLNSEVGQLQTGLRRLDRALMAGHSRTLRLAVKKVLPKDGLTPRRVIIAVEKKLHGPGKEMWGLLEGGQLGIPAQSELPLDRLKEALSEQAPSAALERLGFYANNYADYPHKYRVDPYGLQEALGMLDGMPKFDTLEAWSEELGIKVSPKGGRTELRLSSESLPLRLSKEEVGLLEQLISHEDERVRVQTTAFLQRTAAHERAAGLLQTSGVALERRALTPKLSGIRRASQVGARRSDIDLQRYFTHEEKLTQGFEWKTMGFVKKTIDDAAQWFMEIEHQETGQVLHVPDDLYQDIMRPVLKARCERRDFSRIWHKGYYDGRDPGMRDFNTDAFGHQSTDHWSWKEHGQPIPWEVDGAILETANGRLNQLAMSVQSREAWHSILSGDRVQEALNLSVISDAARTLMITDLKGKVRQDQRETLTQEGARWREIESPFDLLMRLFLIDPDESDFRAINKDLNLERDGAPSASQLLPTELQLGPLGDFGENHHRGEGRVNQDLVRQLSVLRTHPELLSLLPESLFPAVTAAWRSNPSQKKEWVGYLLGGRIVDGGLRLAKMIQALGSKSKKRRDAGLLDLLRLPPQEVARVRTLLDSGELSGAFSRWAKELEGKDDAKETISLLRSAALIAAKGKKGLPKIVWDTLHSNRLEQLLTLYNTAGQDPTNTKLSMHQGALLITAESDEQSANVQLALTDHPHTARAKSPLSTSVPKLLSRAAWERSMLPAPITSATPVKTVTLSITAARKKSTERSAPQVATTRVQHKATPKGRTQIRRTIDLVDASKPKAPARTPTGPQPILRTPADVPVMMAKRVHDLADRVADSLGAANPAALPFRMLEFMMRPGLVVGEMAANKADALINGAGPSRKYDHLAANDPAFLDELFAQDAGWTHSTNGEAAGRRMTIGRRTFSETKIIFEPPKGEDGIDRSHALLRAPWKDYKGTYELIKNHTEGPDAGKTEYDLYPTGKLPVIGGLRVHETMLKALDLSGGGLRVPIALEGGAEGLAYIDLRPLSDGRVELNARFAGVEPGETGELFGPDGYLKNHVLVEGGDGNEIPLIGLITPDDGGILGMIKGQGWKLIPPGSPSAKPTASEEAPIPGARVLTRYVDEQGRSHTVIEVSEQIEDAPQLALEAMASALIDPSSNPAAPSQPANRAPPITAALLPPSIKEAPKRSVTLNVVNLPSLGSVVLNDQGRPTAVLQKEGRVAVPPVARVVDGRWGLDKNGKLVADNGAFHRNTIARRAATRADGGGHTATEVITRIQGDGKAYDMVIGRGGEGTGSVLKMTPSKGQRSGSVQVVGS